MGNCMKPKDGAGMNRGATLKSSEKQGAKELKQNY